MSYAGTDLASDLQHGFRLGPWKIEPLRGALTGTNGETHHLEPKVMDVLVYLAEHANELVSRDELLSSVWSGHVAADELLTGAISDLRRALQESKGDLKYIETIPKRGYRLVGEVRRTTDRRKASWAAGIALIAAALVVIVSGDELRERWLGETIAESINSIAVLPLENFSGDPEQEYFTDGMTEALIAELGHIKALKVTSRTSVEVYEETNKSLPEIAAELEVDALIEGSVLWAGDEVRITVQLLHGPTDQHLWSENFRRPLRDVLTLQREVAESIAKEIKVTLSPQEELRFSATHSVVTESYTLWLKGNYHLAKQNEDSFRQALASYREAIDRDARFAPAYAGMAMAYVELGGWMASGSPNDVVRPARQAAERALALDPSVGDAHLALGRIRSLFDWDWAGADRAFERGIAMQPGDTAGRIEYANFLTAMGRFEKSIEIGRRTLQLDPLSPPAYNELGFALWHAGRDDEALKLYLEGLEIAPDFPQTLIILSDFYLDKGDSGNALAYVDSLDGILQTRAPMTLAIIGRIYGLAGRHTEARVLLSHLMDRRSQEFVPATAMTYLHLGLAEYDEALEWLEIAYQEHDVSLIWLKENWMYDPLRSDPRFQNILDRMDFPEP